MRREQTCRTTDGAPAEAPLVVDVDGSLTGGDLLIEGIARLLSVSPLSLFALPFWLSVWSPQPATSLVMPGFVPGISFSQHRPSPRKLVDGRNKSGHDVTGYDVNTRELLDQDISAYAPPHRR